MQAAIAKMNEIFGDLNDLANYLEEAGFEAQAHKLDGAAQAVESVKQKFDGLATFVSRGEARYV